MKYEPKIPREVMCPIEYGLDLFGGKWKSRIICVLSSQPVMRYNEIRKELGNITDAVLAADRPKTSAMQDLQSKSITVNMKNAPKLDSGAFLVS